MVNEGPKEVGFIAQIFISNFVLDYQCESKNGRILKIIRYSDVNRTAIVDKIDPIARLSEKITIADFRRNLEFVEHREKFVRTLSVDYFVSAD